MSSRKLSLFPLVALLGAAVVVLPAALAAAPSEVKLEANENCIDSTWPCWTSSSGAKPPPNEAPKIAAGGTVKFVDASSSGVSGDVIWSGSAPECTPAVPTAPTSGWESTCKFPQAGVYKFESPTMYAAYRRYEIVVEGSTGTTPMGTGTSTEGGSSNPTGSGGSNTGSGSTTPGTSGSTTPLGSLFVGSASQAVKLASTQHGKSVRGSVDVSQAGTGGTLEVQLLANSASLASAGHQSHVRVGRVVHGSLHAGTVTFSVALDAKAKHALRRRGHLTLTVKVVLSAAGGSPATVTRSVTLRG